MKSRPPVSIAVALRPWRGRVGLALLVSLSLGLLAAERSGAGVAPAVRSAVLEGILPLVRAASAPLDAWHDAKAWVAEMMSLQAENVQLRLENQKLREWQSVAQAMQAENEQLHLLSHFVPDPEKSFVTARIVADAGGPFADAALMRVGTENQVRKGQAVVAPQGLIGRVTEAGEGFSRILLITDPNSRIPVMTEQSRERAILAGDRTHGSVLLYLAPQTRLQPGERLLTSGDGGVMPAGIPVAAVAALNEGGSVLAKPLADWRSVEFATIIRFPK